jgi:hypothetical protein
MTPAPVPHHGRYAVDVETRRLVARLAAAVIIAGAERGRVPGDAGLLA